MKFKFEKKGLVISAIIGLALVIYSLTLDPFVDKALFEMQYQALTEGESEAFYALRESLLSPKYQIQDIGFSLLLLSLLLLTLLSIGKGKVCSPRSRARLLGVAWGCHLSP